jgi:phosphoglycerol transferase MdoB-like AlkP superfamily enzyme
VRAIGLLLILEVLGLAGLGVYEFAQVDWQQLRPEAPSQQAIEVLALLLFVPPAVMTLLSALSFLLLRRRGWLLAAIAQGVSLGICLWLYSEFQPVYVYPIMAYCILMILYLNSQDVRVVFHPRRDKAERKSEAPHAG